MMLTYTREVAGGWMLMLRAWLTVAGIRAEAVFPGAALVLLGGHRQRAPPSRRRQQPLGDVLGPGGPRRLGRGGLVVAQNRLDGKAGNRPRRALVSAVLCATHPRLITEGVTALNGSNLRALCGA